MSFTLLEGVIAIVLIWIAWRIGSLLAPYVIYRMKSRRASRKFPPERKDKPPIIID